MSNCLYFPLLTRYLYPFVYLLIFVAVSQSAYAQPGNSKKNQYQDVFNLIFKDGRKAKIKLDSLKELNSLTLLQRIDLYNITGVYHGVQGQLDSAAYYFNYVTQHTKDKDMLARALHNLAIIQKQRAKYEEASELVGRALKLFQEVGNQEREAVMYGEMANIYKSISLYELALEYQLKAIEIQEQLKRDDPHSLNLERQKLAEIYLTLGDYEFAGRIYEQNMPFFKERGDRVNYTLLLINYSRALADSKRGKESEKMINEAIQILETDYKNNDVLAMAYKNKATVLNAMNASDEETSKWYEKAIATDRQSNGIYSTGIYFEYLSYLVLEEKWQRAYNLLVEIEREPILQRANLPIAVQYQESRAKIFEAKGLLRESIQAWRTSYQMKDSLNQLKQSRRVLELQDKYKSQVLGKEVEIERLRADVLEKKVRNQTLNLFFALLLASLISLVAIQYVRKNTFKQEQLQKLREAQELLLKEKALVQKVLTQQKTVIEAQQQQLMSNALEIANQNEKIEAILEKAEGQSNVELSNLLKGLKSSDQYWESLMLRFRHLNPHFMEQLQARFPQLTQSEIEFCALVRLNLSFKDIANLMQISHRSVFTKKYRIAQKMKVNEDEDFFQVIRDATA